MCAQWSSQMKVSITLNATTVQLLLSLAFAWNLLYNPWTFLCQRHYEERLEEIDSTFTCDKANNILKQLREMQNLSEKYDKVSFKIRALHYCPRQERIIKNLLNFDLCQRERIIISKIQNITSNLANREILREGHLVDLKSDIKEEQMWWRVFALRFYTNVTNVTSAMENGRRSFLEALYRNKSENYTFRHKLESSKKMLNRKLHWLRNEVGYLEEAKISFMVSHGIMDDIILIEEMSSALSGRNESRQAIFYTETSGTGTIKARFVCALESAAVAYPDGDIYLLISYLPPHGLIRAQNEALSNVLAKHSNIRVLNVNMSSLFMGSPLESFYVSGKLNSSAYLAAHTSDMIRILVVWMYGGMYFDLDIITVRRLRKLKNFIIQESNLDYPNVANGAFAFEKHSKIGDYMFEQLKKKFNGQDWGANGPGMFLEAMQNHTGVGQVKQMNDRNLKQFVRLKYDTLFPVEWFELGQYFDEKNSSAIMAKISQVKGLWGFHVGNNIAKDDVVNVGSIQPYGLIAQKYCPRAYWTCHLEF